MKKIVMILCCLLSSTVHCWISFTNTLPEKLKITVYLENDTERMFYLEPNQTSNVLMTDANNPQDEIPVTEIVVESDIQVIKNWNYIELPDPNNPHKPLVGKPIYGNKRAGNLDLNPAFKCTTKFKTKDKALAKYNGMVTKCRRSNVDWGLDTSKRPLELIIIEQRNPAETLRILDLIPQYYKDVVPAGTEVGGLELVILAREIKE